MLPPLQHLSLSLHNALPISPDAPDKCKAIHGHSWWVTVTIAGRALDKNGMLVEFGAFKKALHTRSEEHTSELQSRGHLVCRLLLVKKNLTVIIRSKYFIVI